MPIAIGHVEALFRYPVKSMAGERLEAAHLGWHGLEGDRRLHFGGWRTAAGSRGSASKPRPVLLAPHRRDDAVQETFLRTCAPRRGRAGGLRDGRSGSAGTGPVEMMHLDRGIFDEATLFRDRHRYGAGDRTTRGQSDALNSARTSLVRCDQDVPGGMVGGGVPGWG
jgi:hypothetical protein